VKTSLLVLIILNYSFAQPQSHKSYIQKGNSVICGNARFEFFTPSLGRMEYSPSGAFIDEPTVVVMNRDFPDCKLNVEQSEGWLVASTNAVTLKYRVGSGKFGADNLQLLWHEKSVQRSWKPGQPDTGNLGGVAYSLDGVRSNKPPQFPPGILSREGYFVLDDSKSPTWNKSTNWINARKETDNQDWYWIVYRHNYASGLKEYSELTGKIPMIPRYAFGTWITDLNYEYLPGSELVKKYVDSDKNVESLVQKFKDNGIPLDILVLDFAWHKFGWQGGFDWSPIFPDPKGFLNWAHKRGIKISLNDHPGYANEGVLSAEDNHANRIIGDLNIKEPPKPTFSTDLSERWRFRTDPANVGVKEKWYSEDFVDTTWNLLQAGIDWEEQGYPGYDGFAWYRKNIKYPDVPEGTPIKLIFGGVDDEYDLFVNGTFVGHHGSSGSSIWSSLTSTDVTSILKRDSENLIVLRVNDWGGGGGISKLPVGLSDVLPYEGIRFNLADKKQADVFMNVLHNPLIDQGLDFWWIDGGMGASKMDGLDGQMWTNRVYFDYTQEHTKKRAFIFSRYGGWGNHRYPGIFTGDTYSEWDVLHYEVVYSAQAGNVLMPYVTHDIGGFLGRKIPFDLYARWIQFGVFNPLVRLHSAFENPKDGNLRMPWNYGTEGVAMVRKYFALRCRLLPYIYTYSREAYDRAMPLNRPLYLQYPDLNEAYKHPDEYFFGRDFLCAPIVDSTNERDVYLPPGVWFDYFSDRLVEGGQTIHTTHTLEDFPLFVRDGSIIPTRPGLEYSDQRPMDSLSIDIYGLGESSFKLYEDDGISLDYEKGAAAWTPISSRSLKSKGTEIVIGPTAGEFQGQPLTRAYTLILHGTAKPKTITANGHVVRESGTGVQSWNWNEQNSRVTIRLSLRSIRERVTLVVS
jgi:alpha-glucosidase (family GH31 glycosyl hydrolase)